MRLALVALVVAGCGGHRAIDPITAVIDYEASFEHLPAADAKGFVAVDLADPAPRMWDELRTRAKALDCAAGVAYELHHIAIAATPFLVTRQLQEWEFRLEYAVAHDEPWFAASGIDLSMAPHAKRAIDALPDRDYRSRITRVEQLHADHLWLYLKLRGAVTATPLQLHAKLTIGARCEG